MMQPESMMQRYERTGSFLPAGVAYAINDGPNGLRMVTYSDLKAQRIARQRVHLESVESVPERRRAAFIWAFYQPGLFGCAYMGWWAYLRVCGHPSAMKLQWNTVNGHDLLARRCMELFPCGFLPLSENFDAWKEAFGIQYRRPGRFKKQGLAPVWITYSEGRITHIEAHLPPTDPPSG